MKKRLTEKFEEIFNYKPDGIFFAPGRVNLIGDHIDYNGGYVFPCAINLGTYVAIGKRMDNKLRFYSENFTEDGILESDLKSLENENKWNIYPLGVISEMNKIDSLKNGFDMVVFGDIPNGSGLSSSASIEVATAYAVSKLYEIKMTLTEMATLCQRAENNYCKMNCGIMDQFAIALGKSGSAIMLNTRTEKFQYVELNFNDENIVISCTNKKRKLTDSKYNERRQQCEKAASVLGVKYLCDLSSSNLDMYFSKIDDEILKKRVRHVISENERTIASVCALNERDIVKFGEIMNKSQESLCLDYEVTGIELDTIYESALKQNGTYGSRMTGAGFGGCNVSIVKSGDVSDFISNVGKEYENKMGYKASFYVVKPGDGPREL